MSSLHWGSSSMGSSGHIHAWQVTSCPCSLLRGPGEDAARCPCKTFQGGWARRATQSLSCPACPNLHDKRAFITVLLAPGAILSFFTDRVPPLVSCITVPHWVWGYSETASFHMTPKVWSFTPRSHCPQPSHPTPLPLTGVSCGKKREDK